MRTASRSAKSQPHGRFRRTELSEVGSRVMVMAVGQAVLAGTWDVAVLRAAEDRLEQRAVDAGRVHAALLRDVLVVHNEYSAVGMSLSAQPQIALLLRCSEWRAGKLLNEALGLAEMPEALTALQWGLLTVEQSSVLVAQLTPLNPPDRLKVWQRPGAARRRGPARGPGPGR